MSHTLTSHSGLTVSQAASYLGVTERTIQRWVSRGLLPAYRIGPRLIRIQSHDLEALVQPTTTVGAA